jgi:hypothetical protein
VPVRVTLDKPEWSERKGLKSKEVQMPGTKLGKLRIYVQPQEQAARWVAAIGAGAALLGATGLIAGGIWLGLRLIVNPNIQGLLDRFFPYTTRSQVATREPAQNLEQIKAEIVQKQLIPGEPVFINPSATKSDVLLPVLAMRPKCQTECQQIVELRVYQPANAETYYRLASTVAVTAPDRSFVLAPLNNVESDKTPASGSLPLTEVSVIDDKAPAPGVWINLAGKLAKDDTSVAYGQLLHYNPSSDSASAPAGLRLNLMLSWTSPSGQAPYWQEVTGGGTPELLVNQTVVMEPQYQVYQIVPRQDAPGEIYLEEISLDVPALDSELYRNALMLAENNLWSTAWSELQSLNKKKLPTIARSQLDLIRLHAELTQAQAQATWASPSQQVNAFLINGSWQQALEVFNSSDNQNRYEIAMSLKTDSGRLWKRVEAAIAVKPSLDVKAWGVLIKAAQQGRQGAIAWLQQQPLNTPQTMARINELLEQLDVAQAEAQASETHFSQIVGNALPLPQINPADWLQPNSKSESTPSLQLEPQQVWYQVQVTAFNDGQRWQSAPFFDLKPSSVEPALQLWKLLGLNTDSQIMLTVWTPDGKPRTAIGTVKAVQIKSGVLQLLASGEDLRLSSGKATNSSDSPHLLAHTRAALELLEPDSTTLSELSQQQPLWISAILPALWRELQSANYLKPGRVPSPRVMLEEIGNWSVQTRDLTGNNQPEAVLKIYPEMVKDLKFLSPKPAARASQMLKPRTVIFSDAGSLLYSELAKNAKQSLRAIAQLGDGDTPALVVNDSSNYSLKRWSAQRQRFE